MKLKDVLHYYIGAKAEMPGHMVIISHALLADDYSMKHYGIRPILRPLISMTREEAIGYAQLCCKNKIPDSCDVGISLHENCGIHLSIGMGGSGLSLFPGGPHGDTIKEFHYLLSKHFDIFGLIESGQAIDINTLKQQ